VEASPHLHRTVQAIKALGKRAGVAINPATPVGALEPILPELDLALLMSVNPGFGGQQFIPQSFARIAELRRLLEAQRLSHVALQVDGGINAATIAACRDAGASVAVVGSAVFNPAKAVAEAVRELEAALG
jgi:ribulose-phosphate 3-epimerase